MKLFFVLFFITFSINSYASNCTDKLKNAIKTNVDTSFNEDLLKWVIKNRMFLDELKGFDQKILSSNFNVNSINTMLDNISNNIYENHPAIYQFACFLNNTNSIKWNNNSKNEIRNMLHYMIALNVLTKSAIENKHYMEVIKDYFLSKRNQFLKDNNGNNLSIADVTGKSKALKIKLLDSAFEEYLEFRKDGVSGGDKLKKNIGLLANIKWAAITDKRNNFYANYKAANKYLTSSFYLPTNLVQELYLDNEDFVIQKFQQNWTKLYQSWNLAFVLGNMKDLYIYLPKLLIPTVLEKEEEKYLMTRTMALWPTINIALFHEIKYFKDNITLPQINVPYSIVNELGLINLDYAKSIY